jgi:cephalosporin-C deacetylase-like acetyl esterase
MNTKKLTVLLTTILMLCTGTYLFAQKKPAPKVANKAEIVITEHAADPHSIFKLNDTVKYNIDLKSTYNTPQQGQISYHIMDFKNNIIAKQSYPVSIPAQGSKQVQISMPGQKPGFYKVNFMLNVTEDDDTVRRVFGVDTSNIHSGWQKPADFDQFWSTAKAELAKVAPEFKMTERPDMSGGNDQVYLIEMKSLGNITIRGWLTLPKDRKANEKLPIVIGFPGYGGQKDPYRGITKGIAYFGINPRGLGNSRDVFHPTRDDYISYDIQDKNKYVMRGAIMDCIRAVDFVLSRPEVDATGIYADGASMGGYLSIILSSFDSRIHICSASNPTFSDFRTLAESNEDFPMGLLRTNAKKSGLAIGDVLNTLDYFDLKYFASNVKCPVVMGMGLLDNIAPPFTEIAVYNNIPTAKKVFMFPNIGHGVGSEMNEFVGKWVYDELKIYQKWAFYNIAPTATPGIAAKPAMRDPYAEAIDVIDHPSDKNAIFKSGEPVSYTLDVSSTFKTVQNGKLSYTVINSQGKFVTKNSVPISIPPKTTKYVAFDIPTQTAGFYSVNFAINTTDYDDTVRRAFGVDTNKIHGIQHKPADFDAFWQNAKKELAAIAPNFKMIEKPELAHGTIDKVYLIEMQSLGNVTIRGYLSLPNDRKPNQKLPISVYLPGYGAQAYPQQALSAMAFLSLSVRGQPLSDDVIKPGREDYITTDIADKNKYILRGVLMDCVRTIDFVCSRPELDLTGVYVTGASMGGYLALALAGIDGRVNLASANNPVFSDFRSLAVTSSSFPMSEIKFFSRKNSVKMDALLNNLDYYDLQNFTGNIRVSTVTAIGLLDDIAPPAAQFQMFNNIAPNKKILVYPYLAHDVGPDAGNYVGKWVYTNLKVYEKWKEFNAQNEAAKAKEEESGTESVAITDHPGNPEAVYKSGNVIDYSIDFKNNFLKKQSGQFTYLVFTSNDVLVRKDSLPITLDPRSTKRVHIEIPPQKTGFYKVSFAINVTDYDDTLKRVFGVNIEGIRSDYQKPADFDKFWVDTKAELAKIPPNFKMTEHKEMETGAGEQIYLIEMQSLGNITIRGWLTLPKDRRAKERFPVMLQLPGYGNELKPTHGISQFAILALNVRGQGNSRDVIHPDREDYISYNLEDRDKFIYRGSIMDGIRAIDFIYAHPELFDPEFLYVTGGSQGGYLTLTVASLDHRVSICAADNPGYIDLKMPYYNGKWPITVFHDYADTKGVKFETLMNNFEYFNLKSFVPNIQCKVVVGIGLLDPLVPPTNELIMYNNIKTPKKLFIYPNLTHEVGPELFQYKMRWMVDNLGL